MAPFPREWLSALQDSNHSQITIVHSFNMSSRDGFSWTQDQGLKPGVPCIGAIQPPTNLNNASPDVFDVIVVGAGYCGLTASRDTSVSGKTPLFLCLWMPTNIIFCRPQGPPPRRTRSHRRPLMVIQHGRIPIRDGRYMGLLGPAQHLERDPPIPDAG